MAPTDREYESLLDRARVAVQEGAVLESNRVYYSARDPLGTVLELSGDEAAEAGGRRFRGKISRGVCVEAQNTTAQTPRGLSGLRIGFLCNERPQRSRVYRRTGVHRGNCGLIEDRAHCKVLVPYYLNRQ